MALPRKNYNGLTPAESLGDDNNRRTFADKIIISHRNVPPDAAKNIINNLI